MLFLFACIVMEFSSCQRKGVEEGTSLEQKNETSDTAKYIKIADAVKPLESWSKSNTLICHDIAEPDDLHPTNGNSIQRSEIFLYTQMSLLTTDLHTLTPRASLVKSLPEISADGLEYKYELRAEPRWDDGSPVSVEDVIFTFKAYKSPLTDDPHVKPDLENILDIQQDGSSKKKFTIKMKKQYIKNLTVVGDVFLMQRRYFDPNNVLSHYTFAQLDKTKYNWNLEKDYVAWAAMFNSAKYSRDIQFLTGLGPYKIERWDVGQSMTLKRKENHWSQNSKISFEASFPEKIILKYNRDVNSQMLEFKAQAYDASTTLSTAILLKLQKDKEFNRNYNSRFTITYNYYYIGMNTRADGILHKKIFTDIRVRKAMAYLIPVDLMNKIINKGKNKRMVGPVSPLKREVNDSLKPIPFDVAKARKLLDEAGWIDTDGDFIRDKMVDGERVQLSFNLNYMTTQLTWKEIAQISAEALYKGGVKANITPLDFAVFYDRAKNHDFDMMIAGWVGDATPDDFTQLWHTSSWSSKGSNFVGFGNNYTDAIIDSIKYAIDDKIRIPMVKRFQTYVYDQQPYVFLYSGIRRSVIHKRFGNQEMYFERHGVLLNTLKLLQ